MSPRTTWLWLTVAGALFAFIFYFKDSLRPPPAPVVQILPGFSVSAVSRIQVRPENHLAIRALRTNGAWQVMTEAQVYPAQTDRLESFLAELNRLAPATYIAGTELRGRPNSDEEFGFMPTPQATIMLDGQYHAQLRVGFKTAPGDQVFLQRVGAAGVFVVDADLLNFLPRTANDWRNRTFIDLSALKFDRIAVTNGPTSFVLQRNPSNHLWRILPPIEARANSARIEDALQKIQTIDVNQFVPEDPKPDLEGLGLQPPALQLVFSQGTNLAAALQFGKSPTNDAGQVFARCLGQDSLVTISNDLIAPWRDKLENFHDPHLLALSGPVAAIEVHGEDTFTLEHQGNNWRVLPQDLPADNSTVEQLLSDLTGMSATLVKGVVIEQDWPTWGLASPRRRYVLKSASLNDPPTQSNATIAELDFGSNQKDRVFARRADEFAVYAVSRADFQRLPAASWQLRERRIWNFSTNDLAGITLRYHDKVRQAVRTGVYDWSLAPHSQGIIEPLRTEETVRGLCHLSAQDWVARGAAERARYSFADNGAMVTLDLKSGEKARIEFGGAGPSGYPYAGLTLDGEFWVCDIPPLLCRDVLSYLLSPLDGPGQ